MKKLLAAGLPILAFLVGLPILALAVITTSTSAAADCQRGPQPVSAGDAIATGLGDLGEIDGPIGGPVNGQLGLATANIPNRSGLDGFRSSMPKVLASDPDFVTLNEVSGRSISEIEGAAPGYSAYRDPVQSAGPGGEQSMGNVVLWKNDAWTQRAAGRVKIVEDDQTYYNGKEVTWDRFATWVMLQRKRDNAVVSVIAVHQMTNPAKYPKQHDDPPLTRAQQYGQGMDTVVKLTRSLATHGPVFVGGDMNTQANQANLTWTAAAKMEDAGFRWYDHAVDFVFFPRAQGVTLDQGSSGPMVSDHQWVAARFNMNGAGPAAPDSSSSDGASAEPIAATGPASDVHAQLMRLRFNASYPTLTDEQASNAIRIAQVARDLNVPRRGLEIALATAIQESKLVNLPGGDRDSGGLFQQRPSSGWGTREQITNPQLAAQAFFGRAAHTNNSGLLDIPAWEKLPLTDAAQAVQRSGFPNAYAQWESVAKDMADLLGGDLPDVATVGEDGECASAFAGTASVTLATLNLLGAGHTDGKQTPGGNEDRDAFGTWDTRLPAALSAIESNGATIAGLQEVHGPQSEALKTSFSGQWGMYPAGTEQNKVIWDRNYWTMSESRLVKIPYFNGNEVGMPLVKLTSTTTEQSMWVWSIHNPANTHGDARAHRVEALRRQAETLAQLKATGTPVVILGDFNDGKDGHQTSHCSLTPTMTNAFGGTSNPCQPGKGDAPIDHIYGANLTWVDARVDQSTKTNKISDHPLVVASVSSGPLATNIVDLATQLAWADGRKVCCGANVATPAFVAAKARAMRIDPDPQPTLYASCDRFVATVLKLTVDQDFPWGDSTTEHTYLMNSPKWTPRTGTLQPGDVLSTPGHILIYLGNGRTAQASYMNYVPKLGTENWPASPTGDYRPLWESRTYQAFHFTGTSQQAA